jgi:mono/diheme cytochrome c family protein
MWKSRDIPSWMWPVILTVVVLSWLPLALIVRARAASTTQPRIHLVQDMDNQAKYKPQDASTLFADGRAMRLDPKGTVAQGELAEDVALSLGKVSGGWVTVIPVPLSPERLRRGRERFAIYCAPCHGLDGNGHGPVASRAEKLEEGTWVPPSSLHAGPVRALPVGQIYDTIAHGVRNMPSYGSQIGVEDRWAVVAHVRALQQDQHAEVADAPAADQDRLR